MSITSRGSAFILFWFAVAASSELSTSLSFFLPSYKHDMIQTRTPFTRQIHYIQKSKGVFIWRSNQSVGPLKALKLFLPWQTCSFWHQLGFSGKHSATIHTARRLYSFIFPLLSIARYSFIQLSELSYQGENTAKHSHKYYLKTKSEHQ